MRNTVDGFTRGKVTIEGIDNYKGENNLIIEYQNEYIIAYQTTYQSMLATAPDLISLVTIDTAEPVTTDEIKYGLRISVIAMPSSTVINCSKALEFTGPKAFGFDCEYKKLSCMYATVESITKRKMKEWRVIVGGFDCPS